MLRFLLLGPLEIQFDEKPIALPPHKVALLLSYLVANRNHSHARDVLAELFWGNSSQKRARSSLRQALHVLKQYFPTPKGQELLVTSVGALRFNPEIRCELDLDHFNAALAQTKPLKDLDEQLARMLAEALQLYRGPFLSGFYEDWVLQEQLHWQDHFLEGSLRLALHYEMLGAYHRSIEICRRALAFYPHHEVLCQLLMRTLALSGDRKTALAQYQEIARNLRDEMSLDPLPETRMLYEQIRDNQLRTHRAASFTEAVHRLPKKTPLVGREQYLHKLMTSARASREKSAQAILLSGDPGIGKSRILREALVQLEDQGWLCLHAECLPSSPSPFEPLISALQHGLEQPEKAIAELPDYARAELLELIPAWGTPARAAPSSAPDQVQRKRFLALGLLLEMLSKENPVCVALDDLQWVDESTVRFLEYLFRRRQQRNIFWLGCSRNDRLRPDHPLTTVTQSLAALGILEQLKVEPLGNEESRRLISKIFEGTGKCSENFTSRLVSLSQGNPFYLSELAFELKLVGNVGHPETYDDGLWMTQLMRHLPQTLEAALNERLRRLSSRGRALLNAAAVLGKRWAIPLAVAVSRQRRPHLIEAAKELMQFNLLLELEESFQFRHDLIREYVLFQLSAAERKYLHELAAIFLENRMDSTDANPVLLASHFEQAGLLNRAAHYWLIASGRSLKTYALKETRDYLAHAMRSIQNALETQESSDRHFHEQHLEYWTQRAALHNFLGERDLQRQAVVELEKLAGQRDDERTRLVAHLHHAHLALKTGHLSEAICEAKSMQQLAVTQKNPTYERAACQMLSMAYEHSGDYENALLFVEKFQTENEVPTDYLWIFDYTGSLYAYLGQFDKALAFYERKLDLHQNAMDIYYEVEMLTTLAIIHEHIGNYAASIQSLEQVLELSKPLNDGFIEGRTLANLGSSHWGVGNLIQSLRFFEQALQLFERIQHKRAQMVVKANLGTVWGDLGQFQQAVSYFDSALPVIEAEGLKDLEIEILWRKAVVLTKLGERQAALILSEKAVSKIDQGARLQNQIRAFMTHSRVLEANCLLDQSKLYLNRAYNELIRQASQIQDRKLHQMFLENIRDHREIITAWNSRSGG